MCFFWCQLRTWNMLETFWLPAWGGSLKIPCCIGQARFWTAAKCPRICQRCARLNSCLEKHLYVPGAVALNPSCHGCDDGFWMILVLSDVLITGCVHHGQSSLVLWRGTWCCGLFEVSFVVRPPSRPYMKIRWRPPGDHPPRSAIKHRLSPVRSLGKRRFTSDTCRIRVLPWRSERTTFCLCWWFLNCLYKLQVITRLQYDQCTCLYDVSRHHARLAVLLHLFAHTVS